MSDKRYWYTYDGPVMEFGKVVANRWTGGTFAPSEARARSNLTYQFKQQYGRTPNTKITLPGKIQQNVARGKTS